MGLSKQMLKAIELLKKEEFYLLELTDWSLWRVYNLPGEHIKTDIMKTLKC